MIDLHCHVLPEVDDGSNSMDETIRILKKAEIAGFHTICFTPHYAEPTYINDRIKNHEILQKVRNKLKEENISIDLLLGNEIFINEQMANLLEDGKISTLANTPYVLIEVPMYQELPPEVVQKMLESVQKIGCIVVIAHPERYSYIQRNPDKLVEYFGENVIFQGNYASILGVYGRAVKKTIKILLKNKAIHYLATDTHHDMRCFYEEMELIQKKLLKVVDKNYFEILTQINPRLIIENKKVIKDVENGKQKI